MEAQASQLSQARAAVLSRIEKVPGSETAPSVSPWRERLPLLAAIAVTAMAGGSCVLGLSWLAVISVSGPASASLGPWAIGSAVLAVAAFAAGITALLRPRLRMTLVAVASVLMVLLVTTVIGLTMSAPEDLNVRAAGAEALVGNGK